MSFTSEVESDIQWRRQKGIARLTARQRLHDLADELYIAIHAKRSADVIEALLSKMRAITQES
jgi:hypothetical protein